MHKSLFLLLLFTGSLFAQQQAQNQPQLVDGVAAVVENELILYSDVEQYARLQASQMGITPYKNPDKYKQLEEQMLQSLIDQKIILAKAKEDSVEVKDSEVDQMLQQQIDNMIQQAGSEEALQKMVGMSVREMKKEYREDVRKRLLVDRYQSTKFSDLTVSRKEVEDFYNTYKDSLPDMPKRVNISHIVMKEKPNTLADSLAIAKLKSIRDQIENGASFSAMAEKYSQDPGSRYNGGDLGYVSRGTLVPAFEEKAFSLKPGEISDIVKTEFGYHIIKLIDRRGEKIHVKHILIKPQVTTQDKQEIVNQLKEIRREIKNGAPFDSLAKEYSDDEDVGLNGGNLGWFDVKNLQVPEFKSVLDTMHAGEISQPFHTDFGWHILRLNDVKPGGPMTLKKNWVEIEQLALQKKQSEEYQRWLKDLRKQFYVDVKMNL